QILLAEMQMFGASLDRRAPIIVDNDVCRRALGHRKRIADDLQRLGVLEVLGAQLHRSDAKQCKARDPGDAVDDGIKAVRMRVAIRIRQAKKVSQRLEWKERRNRGLPSAQPHNPSAPPRRRSGTRPPSPRDRRLWRSPYSKAQRRNLVPTPAPRATARRGRHRPPAS